MTGNAVGIDVGGTFAKIGLVTPAGDVIRSTQIPTDPKRAPADFVRHVCSAVRGWKFDSVGLGLAGGVEAETGALLFAPNLPKWIGFPFKKAFESRLKVRAVADNDANVAVWGGYVVGLQRAHRHVLGFTLGTGVGGGLVIGGRLHRGANGAAGEFGHQIVQWQGELCGCGKRGCLEAYAGTYGIKRIARRVMRRLPRPLTPKALAEDRRAKPVWDEVGRWLGVGISNMALALNPDAVLLLGGVARAGKLLLDPVRRVFDRQPFREPFQNLVLLAPAERDWGCVGAALLSREGR